MANPQYFQLDPVKDHESIVKWMVVDTWHFDFVRAVEIALLKTFAFPEISRILVNSGEFLNRTQKRYDDTDLLLSLFIENGYSSPAGRESILRINRMHARHPITNDQMLYVLSTFVVEPIVWIEAYGHRPLNALEREALFLFWIGVGKLMGIKELFGNLSEMLAYHELYERQRMLYSKDNDQLYNGVLPTVAKMMPSPLGTLVKWALPAIMSPRMCAAFGVKSKNRFIRGMVQAVIRTRAQIWRFLPNQAVYRTRMKHPTYPNGYAKEKLGV